VVFAPPVAVSLDFLATVNLAATIGEVPRKRSRLLRRKAVSFRGYSGVSDVC
jgi:hypothetical protein